MNLDRPALALAAAVLVVGLTLLFSVGVIVGRASMAGAQTEADSLRTALARYEVVASRAVRYAVAVQRTNDMWLKARPRPSPADLSAREIEP